MTRDEKIELMAPAGDFECLQEPIDHGSDSALDPIENVYGFVVK